MPIGIDSEATIDYILECDRKKPQGEQTVYKLRWLGPEELAALEDGSMTSVLDKDGQAEFKIKSGTTLIKTLQQGLVGWDNFKDKNGEDIPFKTGSNRKPCHVDNLKHLHPAWRRELCNAITDMNQITEDEEKN